MTTAAPSRDAPKVVKTSTHILSASWVFHWLGLFVFLLPFKLFLKNHFHLDALHVSQALFVAGLPFTIKPIFAWIGDSFAIAGYRRRSWTVVGGVLGATFFLALTPGWSAPNVYVASIFLAEVGYVFVSCSLGGLMVEFGARNSVLGILSSFRGAINQGVNIAVGPLGGFLTLQWIGWTWITSATCALANAALIFGCADRKYQPPKEPPLAIVRGQFKTLLSSRPYWFALIAVALIQIAPGFGTPLTFYQQDTLKLSGPQIGTLTMFNGVGGLLMGLGCVTLTRRLSVGRIFLITTTLNALGTLAYTEYHSFAAASFIEPLGGFVSAGTTVACFMMAGHATPKGIEGLGYSLLMAVNNLVVGLGDMFGSRLASQFHVPFWELVLLNAGTTLLALIVLPFMPKNLKDAKDAPIVTIPSESKSQSGHPMDL